MRSPLSVLDHVQPNPGRGRSVRYSAVRREHVFDVSYGAFTVGLESLFAAFETPPGAAPTTTLSDFALLYKVEHGAPDAPDSAAAALGATYVFKNPLIGPRMKLSERRAGLYLPLRLYVAELGVDQTLATYDVPTSVFAQFASPDVDAFAALLDDKLYALVLDAAELAGQDSLDDDENPAGTG